MQVTDSKIQELKNTSILAAQDIKIENLKLFQFENGEKDYIIADNLDNAISFYISMVGEEETKLCEVTEIKEWFNLMLKEEQDNGTFKNSTFLDSVKETCINGYSNPFYIASTCAG